MTLYHSIKFIDFFQNQSFEARSPATVPCVVSEALFFTLDPFAFEERSDVFKLAKLQIQDTG